MEKWLLAGATVLVILGGGLGILALQRRKRSAWTLVCMIGAFALQMAFLGVRGEARGACPLGDYGEILAFLAWSLVLFYLLVGPTYRVSLLGLFTAPVVAVFQLVALVPGMMADEPQPVEGTTAWGEAHSAFSVLSYGAFALAAVAALMFLVLNRQLKDHHLNTGLFQILPPVRTLSISVVRLTALGAVILTVGMISGFLMEREGGEAHLVAAVVIWAAYLGLLLLYLWRGMTPQRLSRGVIAIFAASLVVFAFV